MDARSEKTAIPLVVDLDGTLIAADLLWESLFLLLRKNPLYLFLVPLWLMRGIANLKGEIASRTEIDPISLPYRQSVLEMLTREKNSGRQLVLATGSPQKFAEAIAGHLGLFNLVLSTQGVTNLTSSRKRAALIEHFGDGGFDYAGNSRADLKVFDAAGEAIVVAPDRHAARWHRNNGGQLFEADRPSLKTVLKMLRVHQWLKNGLVAVPMVLAHDYDVTSAMFACVAAFFSFSMAASAIYILNDFFDLGLDRSHPVKKNRPFASGALSVPFGIGAMAILLCLSFAIAALLPPLFLFVLIGYLVATTAYSLGLKRMLLGDVLTLAGLYTTRILAGAAATATPVSFWLLAFSGFFFLSLALVKRYVELDSLSVENGIRIAGRGYRGEDREIVAQSGVASAFSAALVLALYIHGDSVRELYVQPWLIWPLVPIVLYINIRIWVLARRGEMNDDPVVFIIRDWRSQVVAVFGAALMLIASS